MFLSLFEKGSTLKFCREHKDLHYMLDSFITVLYTVRQVRAVGRGYR